MASRTHEPEPLLTPAEVASMFRVDPKTVTRWCKAGRIAGIKTPGGHHRFRESDVRRMLNENFDVAFTPGSTSRSSSKRRTEDREK